MDEAERKQGKKRDRRKEERKQSCGEVKFSEEWTFVTEPVWL